MQISFMVTQYLVDGDSNSLVLVSALLLLESLLPGKFTSLQDELLLHKCYFIIFIQTLQEYNCYQLLQHYLPPLLLLLHFKILNCMLLYIYSYIAHEITWLS